MTEDKLNPDEIRADMEAGTLGEWRAGASVFYPGLDGPLTARVYTESPPNEIEVTGDKCGTNARRIARLPDLERGYLDAIEERDALRAKNARLREMVGTSISYMEGILEDGCPKCGGDCSSANPPPAFCPMKEVSADLAAARAALNTEGEG